MVAPKPLSRNDCATAMKNHQHAYQAELFRQQKPRQYDSDDKPYTLTEAPRLQ